MSRMSLSNVLTGRLSRPKRLLVYGTEGIGKTTLAAAAPSPIYIAPEDGTAQVDVARFPEPRFWAEVTDALRHLHDDEHEYKTLVVDTLDWLEPMVWQFCCQRDGKKSIDDYGYGKGYTVALDEWRAFLKQLDALRDDRGMDILLIAHSQIKRFNNPEGPDFDRYELQLHTKSANTIKQWCDAVLYCSYETFTREDGKRTRGISSGARLIHTERTAAFDAKNRYGLPESLPLSWADLDEAIKAGEPMSAAEALEHINAFLPKLPQQHRDRVPGLLQRANGDAIKLAQLFNWIKGKMVVANDERENQ